MRWGFDRDMERATMRGANNFKQQQPKVGLLPMGTDEQATREANFAEHWGRIMVAPGIMATQFLSDLAYDDEDTGELNPEEVSCMYGDFLKIVARHKSGRAGGEDGVAA